MGSFLGPDGFTDKNIKSIGAWTKKYIHDRQIMNTIGKELRKKFVR